MTEFPQKRYVPCSCYRCRCLRCLYYSWGKAATRFQQLQVAEVARWSEDVWSGKNFVDMIWKGMPIEWNFRNWQIKIITVCTVETLWMPWQKCTVDGKKSDYEPFFFLGCTNIGVNSWITCQPHLVGDSGWPYLAPGESRWKVCSFRQRNPTSSGGCCKTLAPW